MRDDLPIPSGLQALVEAGVWPTVESADSQNLRSLAAVEDVERLAPGQRSLFLDPPPFRRLAHEVTDNPEFWEEHGALDQIDPDLALVIGDFGLGSDTAIVLDYRLDGQTPSVLRLAWGRDHTTGWRPRRHSRNLRGCCAWADELISAGSCALSLMRGWRLSPAVRP